MPMKHTMSRDSSDGAFWNVRIIIEDTVQDAFAGISQNLKTLPKEQTFPQSLHPSTSSDYSQWCANILLLLFSYLDRETMLLKNKRGCMAHWDSPKLTVRWLTMIFVQYIKYRYYNPIQRVYCLPPSFEDAHSNVLSPSRYWCLELQEYKAQRLARLNLFVQSPV